MGDDTSAALGALGVHESKLKGHVHDLPFETAIIERYRMREASVDVAEGEKEDLQGWHSAAGCWISPP